MSAISITGWDRAVSLISVLQRRSAKMHEVAGLVARSPERRMAHAIPRDKSTPAQP